MCYHNYTQHSGCGHIGEARNQPWTLCDLAKQRLAVLRGPMSPPLSPPASSFQPPKRHSSTTSSTSKLSKRFASLGASISRSKTTSSTSRRAVSGPEPSRNSTSSFLSSSSGFEEGIPDHQLEAVKCANPERRTCVTSGLGMDVCKRCRKWIQEMRFMIDRFDKTGNIKGTSAFEEFLKSRGEEGTDGLYRW